MNRFVRFLLHTVIIVVLFFAVGLGGAGLENSAGGSVTAVSFFAVFGLPLFIILQLAFDTLEDVDNIIVAFLRGALVFIGVAAVVLSFLLQQGMYAGEEVGELASFGDKLFIGAFPASMLAALYLYVGLQFTDNKSKVLIIPVASYVGGFVINLICTLLGKYVAPFFYGWFLFALVAVLAVVLIVVLIKCGNDWTEKMYPSESTKAPSMSEAERKLRVFLNDFKNNPKEYLKYNDITYYTPWSYSLNVSTKRIYFTGAFALTGYQGSREGEKMMNQDVEEILKKGLDYVGESDSYYRSYSWNVEANMTMR